MSSYTEGQIHQLANVLEATNFTPDDITKLGQFKNLSDLRGLFRGTHELKQVKHVIDCDTKPFCPDGWEIVEHLKGRQLKWDASNVELYLSEKQKGESWLEGNKLHKELKGKPVLNANVLDYFLKNPYLIPEEWKNKHVFFWGTIYHDSDGCLVVRCLNWNGDKWDWRYYWLDSDFSGAGSVALLLVLKNF